MEIASFALALFAAAFSVITYLKSVRHDRQKDTIDAYNMLQEQALDHLSIYMPKQIEDISKHPRSEEFKTISHYMARIEHFSVGVRKNVYDRKIVYELASGFLDRAIWNRLESMIDVKGEQYYQNYCWLVRQMEHLRQENESFTSEE